MRLLMVSMFSRHFFNWAEQLKNSGHEVKWIDVFDSNTYIQKIDFIDQEIGWRYKWNYPGRYWVKNNFPKIYESINSFNERDLASEVERIIKEFKPDVVQSFVLFSGAYPIKDVMGNYPNIKWIFSAWGNDLYFMKDFPDELYKIKACLPQFDYMIADCDRDGILARDLGFRGEYLGTFPGGGGYDLSKWEEYNQAYPERNVILIKGYQGMLGRSKYVIKATKKLWSELKRFRIIIFGCSPDLKELIKLEDLSTWPNLQVFENIPHKEVMKLMGKSRIYIGNCISDGMPNTLLEAIVMGAFPIQSNPGGATEEIITHKKNGLLIEDPEDVMEIAGLIQMALENSVMMQKAVDFNNREVRPTLDRKIITQRVLEKYAEVETQIKA